MDTEISKDVMDFTGLDQGLKGLFSIHDENNFTLINPDQPTAPVDHKMEIKKTSVKPFAPTVAPVVQTAQPTVESPLINKKRSCCLIL